MHLPDLQDILTFIDFVQTNLLNWLVLLVIFVGYTTPLLKDDLSKMASQSVMSKKSQKVHDLYWRQPAWYNHGGRGQHVISASPATFRS